MSDFANVAAVNCDDEKNKPLCAAQKIKGFPTLKLVRPAAGRKARGVRPGSVEPYNRGRSAKEMTDALVGIIPDHVEKMKTAAQMEEWIKADAGDDDADASLSDENKPVKVLLVTDKTPLKSRPLFRALAIDFLDRAAVFAQVSSSIAKGVVSTIDDSASLPALYLFGPNIDQAGILYDGKMKKGPLKEFVSKHVPEKVVVKSKAKTKSKAKAKDSPKSEAKDSPKSEASSSSSSSSSPSSSSTSPLPTSPSSSPAPETDPSPPSFRESCLTKTSKICIALILPPPTGGGSDPSDQLIPSHPFLRVLSTISLRRTKQNRHTPPIFVLPATIPEHGRLKAVLGLDDDAAAGAKSSYMVAINPKRSWWRRFDAVPDKSAGDGNEGDGDKPPPTLSTAEMDDQIDAWMDDIWLGGGTKMKLPTDFLDRMAEPTAPDGSSIKGEPPVKSDQAKFSTAEELHQEL